MIASRLTASSCAIALLGLTATAAAAEPLRLSTPQLDAVTAAALSGAEIFVMAAAGINSAGAGAGQAYSSGIFGTNTGTESAAASASSDGDSGAAQIGGKLFNFTTPNSSATLGFFTGETETTGSGTANTGARAIAQGDFAIPFAVTLPVIPGGDKTFSVTLGVAANNPLSPGNGGNNGG